MRAESIFCYRNRKSFTATPENPTGCRGGGSRFGDAEKKCPFVMIPSGKTITLLDVDGPGMIRKMWFAGYVGWHFILRIYWDGESFPSVEAPLSAFCGYAYYENIRDLEGRFPTLNSALLMSAPCRGMNCYFEMPFRKHCKITLENRFEWEDAKGIYYEISGEIGEISEDSMYFHAAYRQSLPVRDGCHVALDGVKGKGVFLGVTLAVGLNGDNGCWVEGEPKIYLDGDRFPSVNYTGLEDYFGGAFAFGYDMMGRYQNFSGLYSGCFAMMGGEIQDRSTSVYNVQPRFMAYRWHLPDPVRFEEDIRFTFSNMGFKSSRYPYVRRDDFLTVAYWYQTEPSSLSMPLPSDREMDIG